MSDKTTTSGVATQTNVNKARLTPGRQWVGINNVEFPVQVQPRAGIDMEWVRTLSEYRREGSEFPPIQVFQLPDGQLIGAEGHHRSLAMLKADETEILCNVVDGTLEDAVVYAAGSNRSNGVKPMGPKDITKAVEMLVTFDEWWAKSNSTIANHVGCSPAKIGAIRSRIALMSGRELPAHLLKFEATSVANATVQAAKRAATRSFRMTLTEMRSFLRSAGFLGTGSSTYPGIGVLHLSGFVACPCVFENADSLPLVVGRLIAARRLKELGARMVVLCYIDDGPAKVIDLYRQDGFEFMSPEELVESLKDA